MTKIFQPVRVRIARSAPRGFSLVEVILALGILAVAIVSILGLIGPTLGFVREAQDKNAATATIGRMNALIDAAPFYDANSLAQSVYFWVFNSLPTSPTVFIFYDEIDPPDAPTGTAKGTTLQRVVRYNKNTGVINTVTAGPNSSFVPYAANGMLQFYNAVISGRVNGSVIAMTLSLSPLVKNFPPASGSQVNETLWYTTPIANSIFPSGAALPAAPNAAGGNNFGAAYGEAYLPILAQVFVLSLDNVAASATSDDYANNVLLKKDLIQANRLFTFTTAKLR